MDGLEYCESGIYLGGRNGAKGMVAVEDTERKGVEGNKWKGVGEQGKGKEKE